MKQFSRFALSTLLPIVAALASQPLAAQSTRVTQALRKVKDFNVLFALEERKTPACTAYVGKVVPLASFDVLARTLPSGGKGEFETAAQYKARLAAGAALAKRGPVIFALPTDPDEISYHLDKSEDGGIMVVRGTAIDYGDFSDEADVQVSALTIFPQDIPTGVMVPYASSTRKLRTYTARTGLGIPIQVTEMERKSSALYVATSELFPVGDEAEDPIIGFEVPLAKAQRIKQTLRVALAVELKAPYVFKKEDSGAPATARTPVHYEEKLTALYVAPKCTLAIDAQSRVLAAVAAGR